MNNQDLALTYLQEADDLLDEIETAALSINSQQSNVETVNHIFRAFHTIKGSGSMFGFDHVAAFTHHMETLLDQVREGLVPVTEQLSTVILAAADNIKALLVASQGGKPVDPGLQAVLLETISQISKPTVNPVHTRITHAAAQASDVPPVWQIQFRPEPTILAAGGSPFLLFRDLKKLGVCHIQAHTDTLPLLPDLNSETCYLWWTIELISSCTEDDIHDVFLFSDGSELVITPPGVGAASLSPSIVSSVEHLLAAQSIEVSVGEVSKGDAAKTVPVPSLPDAPAAGPQAATREATVRVPAERLDRLVNLVGELVMNQSRLARAAAPFHSPELAIPVEEIDRLVAELRDDVLQIRMMPIGTIFGRFRRLVRDLSLQLGKEIELVTEGEETELDKSILDQLGDPLVHMLRNSIDHGIELPAARLAAGKPSRGTIRLIATHRGSDVVVSIEDDGAGLNREIIRSKAISRQLIPPDANLTDKEILNLILLPGFSTAAAVTSLSGRGVGMDVVKRQIDILHGSLNISSEQGQGSCVSLTLPLTLAIIEGLLVETGDSQYIVPMASVMENVELRNADRCLNNGRNMIAVRGELIPYIDLREAFQMQGDSPEISKIVVLRYEDKRVGLVVDRVMGTHQTVIQSLGHFFRDINVVSGSTIMGDGRVALILDITGIVRLAERQSRTEMAA